MGTKPVIFLFVLLAGMLGFSQPCSALHIMPGGSDWARTNYNDEIVQHLPGEPHPILEVSYPIVLYIYIGGAYATRILQYSWANEEYPNGISIPKYVGYMVVEEDFKVKFVDKSNGLIPALAEWPDILNAMPADHLYYFENDTFWVPRWSWNGVQAIINQLYERYSVMAVHATHGLEPMDDFVPEYEQVTSTAVDPYAYKYDTSWVPGYEIITKDSDRSKYHYEGLHPGRVNYPENVKIHRYLELVPRYE